MFISSDDERDPQYVPPGKLNPTRAARTTKAAPTKVAPSEVTASHSEEECILTNTPSGSAAQSEGASGSEDESGIKYPVLRTSPGLRRPLLPPPHPSRPRRMRLIVLTLLQHPRLASPPWLLISPTGGVLRGNIKYTMTPSY